MSRCGRAPLKGARFVIRTLLVFPSSLVPSARLSTDAGYFFIYLLLCFVHQVNAKGGLRSPGERKVLLSERYGFLSTGCRVEEMAHTKPFPSPK